MYLKSLKTVYNEFMVYAPILLFVFLSPFFVLAQEFNAGFVTGLWYSQENAFVEEPIRIYVAIRNNTGADLTGRVEFFNNDQLIEKNEVKALDGRIIESWADWEPTFGSHTITASLSRAELHQVGSSTKTIEVTSSLAESLIFVDYDTDKDGVGNKKDTDDDGDGISDEVEKKNGTDPLTFNQPEVEEDEAEESSLEETNNSEVAESDSGAETTSGIEQFLTPSPAHTALSSITETSNRIKENLDNYRTRRSAEKEEENNPAEVTVNDDGFGEITRTQEPEREIRKPEIKEGGFFEYIISVVSGVSSAVYSLLLTITSFYLGHPIFVQLTILIGILFIIYKLARKFGSRQG